MLKIHGKSGGSVGANQKGLEILLTCGLVIQERNMDDKFNFTQEKLKNFRCSPAAKKTGSSERHSGPRPTVENYPQWL